MCIHFRKLLHVLKNSAGSEMPQLVNVLGANSGNLSLILRIHIVEERIDFYKLNSDFHIHGMACMCSCEHTHCCV